MTDQSTVFPEPAIEMRCDQGAAHIESRVTHVFRVSIIRSPTISIDCKFFLEGTIQLYRRDELCEH